MSFLSFILANKLLIFFVIATAAFTISTITLAVENENLRRKETDTTVTPSLPTTPSPTTTPPVDMAKYRLPTAIKPVKYDLYLYPDLETGLFNGTVVIGAEVREATDSVVLHSKDLKIQAVSVDGVATGQFALDEQYELLTIRAESGDRLKAGEIEVRIEFGGDMRNRIVGLYRSAYAGADGAERFIATSKFEPTFARQAFPCFDEPNLKATYEVHLLRPAAGYGALSNFEPVREETVANGVMVHFAETVRMSTYLVCFIVSDFVSTDDTFRNKDVDVPFKVFATPAQLEKTKYASEVGKKVMEYYVDYFDVKYPLPKLDMVAIPDFVSGAMEHWGLVTFRETALLYTDKTHSNANKERVAEVIAHELAHSWFGNYVTMDWWNNLWLNEGFASYIEYKGVDHVHKDWNMMDQFLTATLHSILTLDATLSSHPIIQTVETPAQITEVFDTVSYNKGAAILRMLEYAISADNFEKGVTSYLNKYNLSNTVSDNLWTELQATVGNDIDVFEFMNTFTLQMGYPILSAKFVSNEIVLTQKRFLTDPKSASGANPSPFNYKWTLPVSFVSDLGESQIYWFKHNQTEVRIPVIPGTKWTKLNPKQVGYYRINYEESVWTNLVNNIGALSTADRTHLIEETFSIAASGDLSYKIALDLTNYLKTENDFTPWVAANLKLRLILSYLENSNVEAGFKKYVRELLDSRYTELNWDDSKPETDEGHLTKKLRVTILGLACTVDYPGALDEANRIFGDYIEKNVEIPPNLRDIVYKYGMVTADENLWEQLFERFTNESDANEKLKIMSGLANIRNPSVISRFIILAEDDKYVRGQDYFTLMTYLAQNPVGTPIVWDYVRENWGKLIERFGLGERNLGRLIPSITASFATGTKLNEVHEFFKLYPDAGAGAAARLQAVEGIENRILWLESYKSVVEAWIQARQ